eukprot:CAMPEP_0198321674 /NCGR_PEP_ID=MMETSP1450-20131203/10338_1 /TAXON_ID=753684 ORGANISM="Madagascaria erythrocladiodes, Strain CCMP3234" /NCGR_SAMPLE_ID=MMETSP1450 /ASSEMBLY_ACC=CAM_ASM_001115 /LENGTH=70 /DNA_ID=CAMNT_0044025251 /DNA_START=132 /DNA_END=344 /DNA_ORIENTATION=-
MEYLITRARDSLDNVLHFRDQPPPDYKLPHIPTVDDMTAAWEQELIPDSSEDDDLHDTRPSSNSSTSRSK